MYVANFEAINFPNCNEKMQLLSMQNQHNFAAVNARKDSTFAYPKIFNKAVSYLATCLSFKKQSQLLQASLFVTYVLNQVWAHNWHAPGFLKLFFFFSKSVFVLFLCLSTAALV